MISDVERMFGVRDAGLDLGEKYLTAVRARDSAAVRELVVGNPDIIWGRFTRQLSSEDFKWTFGILP